MLQNSILNIRRKIDQTNIVGAQVKEEDCDRLGKPTSKHSHSYEDETQKVGQLKGVLIQIWGSDIVALLLAAS